MNLLILIVGIILTLVVSYNFPASNFSNYKISFSDLVAALALIISFYTYFLQKEESGRAEEVHREFRSELERKLSPRIIGNIDLNNDVLVFKKTNDSTVINQISYEPPSAFGNIRDLKSFGNREELNITLSKLIEHISIKTAKLRLNNSSARVWSGKLPILISVDYTNFKDRKNEYILFYVNFFQGIESIDPNFKGKMVSEFRNIVFEKMFENLDYSEKKKILDDAWKTELEQLEKIKKEPNVIQL